MENNLAKRMLQAIENWQNKKIILIGDIIADEYLYGEINRISREAPVFVVDYEKNEYFPGGAGNTALQIKALGGEPILVGSIGEDQEGEEILAFFKKHKIIIDFIKKTPSSTIKKTRIIAGSAHSVKQQILRIDKGKKGLINYEIQEKIIKDIDYLIEESNALVISDYGYGFRDKNFIKKIIEKCNKKGIISIADSRFQILEFKDIYAATPNQPEVEAALRMQVDEDSCKLETAGFTMMSLLNCKILLITRGKKGMAIFEPQKKMELIDIYGTDQIVDVTGAGDVVLGTFALSLAANESAFVSAKLANYAGGIVVMKRGTAQASRSELEFAIRKDNEIWE